VLPDNLGIPEAKRYCPDGQERAQDRASARTAAQAIRTGVIARSEATKLRRALPVKAASTQLAVS